MNGPLLRRLSRLTREEVSWRASAAARTTVDRMAVRLGRRRWNRDDIGHILARGVADVPLQNAIATRQWEAVHDGLAHRLRERASRFALDPASMTAMRDGILRRWPAAAAHAAERADALRAGRYDLLGYRALTFAGADGTVDWHIDPVHDRRAPRRFWADVPYLDPAIGDHKIIWELNRHQHWLPLGRALWLTGDPRYARRIVDELEQWLVANPPLVGINWSSTLELGLRAISWTWGLHFLLGFPDSDATPLGPRSPWLVDMLVALEQQLTHVEQHLSVYFSPNTHLTGEALALYVVGMALPELAASRRWVDTGRRILLEEIERQIHPDGGHVERSTHYQRYTLDFYLMALMTARHAGDTDTERRFAGAVGRLAAFTRTMADDAGRLPHVGDDDGGMLWPFAGRACDDVRDSLAVSAVALHQSDLAPWGVQEEVYWIAGPEAADATWRGQTNPRVPAERRSRALIETGFVVARDAAGSHAVFDVGPHGYLNGGHAHAGALAITLTLAGRPLLIDPGTSTYTMNPEVRDRFRSSMSHNTVTLDGRSQAIPSGPFHWQTRADARLDGSTFSRDFDWVEASHEAYAPVRHRRTLLRTALNGWLVVDDILGEGRHSATAHWHFHPGWRVSRDAAGRLRATHGDGDEAWLLHDADDVSLTQGDASSGRGWYAPAYGTLLPIWAARVEKAETAPFTIVTWLGGSHAATDAPPVLDRIVPACEAGCTAIGARVVNGRHTSVFLLQPGVSPSPRARTCGILDYETDAHTLHYLTTDGPLTQLDLVGASYARTRHRDWLSLDADARMADVHMTASDCVLSLEASRPPPRLRITGAGLRSIVTVRLNHRDYPCLAADEGDALLLSGADWAESPVVR